MIYTYYLSWHLDSSLNFKMNGFQNFSLIYIKSIALHHIALCEVKRSYPGSPQHLALVPPHCLWAEIDHSDQLLLWVIRALWFGGEACFAQSWQIPYELGPK